MLASGPMRGDLQARLAVARVADQPPASTPASLLRTNTSRLVAAGGLLHPPGAPAVDAAQSSVLGRPAPSGLALPEAKEESTPMASGPTVTLLDSPTGRSAETCRGVPCSWREAVATP